MKRRTPKKNNDGKIDMFYGFWKYLGVIGAFLVGMSLFWWGMNIVLSGAWLAARASAGPMGSMVLAPLFVGFALVMLSMVELKPMIL
jgi:hypothetical protein